MQKKNLTSAGILSFASHNFYCLDSLLVISVSIADAKLLTAVDYVYWDIWTVFQHTHEIYPSMGRNMMMKRWSEATREIWEHARIRRWLRKVTKFFFSCSLFAEKVRCVLYIFFYRFLVSLRASRFHHVDFCSSSSHVFLSYSLFSSSSLMLLPLCSSADRHRVITVDSLARLGRY